MFKTKLFTRKYISRYFVSPLKHVSGCRLVSHELRHRSGHLGYISFSGYRGGFYEICKRYTEAHLSLNLVSHIPLTLHMK